MEGMRFRLGRVIRVGSEGCQERDRRRDVCRVGLSDAGQVGWCQKGSEGVGSGTERGK